MTDSERQQILKMIEDGKISPQQGLVLMQALDEAPEDEVSIQAAEPGLTVVPAAAPAAEMPNPPLAGAQAQAQPASDPEFDRKVNRFRRLWVIPLWVGIGLTIAGAYWMYTALQSAGMGFWFFFAWLPFLCGVLLTAAAFSSRTSRWIYINVRQKPGESPQHIVLAFPLSLASWALQFARFSPGLRESGASDDILRALTQSIGSAEPLFVDVHEEDGEHVQVYIG